MKKFGLILMLGAMLTLAACGAKSNDMNKENMMNDGGNASTEMNNSSGSGEMNQEMMGEEMKEGDMDQDMMGDEMKDKEMMDNEMMDDMGSEMGK
ncbi:hypothetical protein [Paenibacillus barengoltzii]|jgi:hypothetical protein|uniref:hypothetical protein n=1 Tax=Paenibacillus barengoltzii TaxID=343517 RepID=UPI002DBBCF74|nr:hypothetical protein [Paenibacillus barengoltzii]MEC2345711.1 hypothetical protein [Paenibacillus barengoltzii]